MYTNGQKIMTGDVVQIAGAYFAKDNGLYLVDRGEEGGQNDSWLKKITRAGKISISGDGNSWPLGHYCSDPRKNREARQHDAEHAEIHKAQGVPMYHVAAYLREQAEQYEQRAEDQRRRYAEDAAKTSEQYAARYRAALERLGDVGTPPEEKAAAPVSFTMNGVRVNGGKTVSAYYIANKNAAGEYDAVTIYGRDYKGLPREFLPVVNNSDGMTDYFENDSATLTPEHPLFPWALYAALRKTAPDEAKKMKNPGPVPADIAERIADYCAQMEQAAEEQRQREAAERAERMEQERKDGEAYIRQTAEQHPIVDGGPVVTVEWSEWPAFYAWGDGELQLSPVAADLILGRFDETAQGLDDGYYKTKIRVDDPAGKYDPYIDRYDLGDGNGGMFRFFRQTGQNELADYLESWRPGGRIVDAGLTPEGEQIIDELAARREKLRKEEAQRTLAEVEMLTDEQLEHAVFLAPYEDETVRDVGRFFLQQLAVRDRDRAYRVFLKWRGLEQKED